MKKSLFLLLSLTLLSAACTDSSITQVEATALVQAQYPEFKDYPSNNLPPKSITAARDNGVWYIAFVQEGSGRPIISATCFKVTKGKTVSKTGTFTPGTTDTPSNISPITCS